MDIHSLASAYPTEHRRIMLLEDLRWEGEPCCPKCGCIRVKPCKWRKHHRTCPDCRREFSVTSGTVFHGTRLGLGTWFSAMALMANSKRGISAADIARHLSVRHATAWSLTMRIRCAMAEWPMDLQGIVEADEMYYGPKKPRKRAGNMLPQPPGTDLSQLTTDEKWGRFPRGKGTIKKPVIGIVERGGDIAVRVVPKATPRRLMELLLRNVRTDEAVLMTDGSSDYNAMDAIIERHIVDHSKKEYARGDVHTNTIESFWGGLKASIRGAHIRVDYAYLPFYVAEHAYRYNRRHLSPPEVFWDLMQRAVDRRKCFLRYGPDGDVDKIFYPDVPTDRPDCG